MTAVRKGTLELDMVGPDLLRLNADQAAVRGHLPDIRKSLDALNSALGRFGDKIAKAPFAKVFDPVTEWRDGESVIVDYRNLGHGPSKNCAVTAYRNLELGPDDPPNRPCRCPGAIGVGDRRIIRHAHEVNRLKSVVKDAFQPLAGKRVPVLKRTAEGELYRSKIAASLFVLRLLGKANYCLLAVYREIPLIKTWAEPPHPETPDTIHFTEVASRSVRRRTVAELKAEYPDLIEILDASGIPDHEYLYAPKQYYSRLRANICFPSKDPDKRGPKNYAGELPILFLLNRNFAPPEVTPPRVRGQLAPRARQTIPLQETPVIAKPAFYRRANPRDRELAKPGDRREPKKRT